MIALSHAAAAKTPCFVRPPLAFQLLRVLGLAALARALAFRGVDAKEVVGRRDAENWFPFQAECAGGAPGRSARTHARL